MLVGDPDLVLDGDAEVAFDARAAKPVTVDVGDDGLEPWFNRLDVRADAFSSSYIDAVTSDGFYAQPMTRAERRRRSRSRAGGGCSSPCSA